MKKIALLCCLITLVGAFVFSGCSNDKPLLTKARENIHEVKSLSYNTETATIATLTENGQVEEINFVGAGTNKTTLEPLATSKYPVSYTHLAKGALSFSPENSAKRLTRGAYSL